MSQLDLKIGPKIKAFRRQLGLQANKLAEELEISPSYLNLIEGGKRKIDGDLLLKVCEKLNIQLSDLTTKSDINLENTISEILDDKLFEDLDILGPEVKDLVGTNPKIGRALVRLGDILKKKDHELINKIEKLSGKIVDNRKNSFPGEVISDFLQENKNYFSKLEEFANKVFEKIQVNNRTRYIALCEYLKKEYSITVKDIIPEDGKPFSKIFNKKKKNFY
ncbi:helix-turn-helix domain-containing protein [Candidatus Pelagibacter sp. Uisw_092]|uniref:helix-turn-helix domain-containing protein n=1 Tax=Candidatus Pelagibacter sp. Uisw_092 TaxID=3230979 RepID=UPI0039EAC77C